MRFKYYLRGCGMGIILTAVILMAASQKSAGSAMSDEQVRQRAYELGMVDASEAGRQNGQPDDDGGSGSPETESKDPDASRDDSEAGGAGTEGREAGEGTPGTGTDAPETSGEGTSGAGTDAPEASGEGTQGAGADASGMTGEGASGTGTDTPGADDEPVKLIISVRRDESCEELAKELYSLGLVDDVLEFQKYMLRAGYDTRIRVGEYELSPGMDMEEIARVFMRR